jgi:hypothetical protein
MEKKIKLKKDKHRKGILKNKYPYAGSKKKERKLIQLQNVIEYNNKEKKLLTSLKDVFDMCNLFFEKNNKKINDWNMSERENCMNITIIFTNNKPLEISLFFFKDKKGDFFFKDIHSQSVHMTIFQNVEEHIFFQKLNDTFNTRYFGYSAEQKIVDILNKEVVGKDFIAIDVATSDQDRLESTDIVLKYQKGNQIKHIPIDIKLNKKAASYIRENATHRATLTLTHIQNILLKNNGKYILIKKLKKLAEDYFDRRIPWAKKEIFL